MFLQKEMNWISSKKFSTDFISEKMATKALMTLMTKKHDYQPKVFHRVTMEADMQAKLYFKSEK